MFTLHIKPFLLLKIPKMSSTTSTKILAFEYVLENLGKWYQDETRTSGVPVFTKLKAFKLLFFVSSAEAQNENLGLLKLFDNHHALPYGPVESDIM